MPDYDSQHMLILCEVRDRIAALNLTDIPDSRIIITDVPIAKHKSVEDIPCVEVSPFGSESFAIATNKEDDIGFPVFVTILDKANQEIDDTILDKRLFWRQRIRNDFIHQRLVISGMDPFQMKMESLGVVDAAAWFAKNLWISALRMSQMTRITRGTT